MTPDQLYEYQERLAICVDNGVPPGRAAEIARQQVEDERSGERNLPLEPGGDPG